ncbi:NAD-dependent protein deacylase [Ruegeria sp.]|uniref:SIR2 family NAD-dependent protein deacylase n=1 Tax=Ruegeria sp. TaxID=1879320 RepID=UPI0023267C6F|nr:NAD-dependent protein deacylase [Ruegeria sp.]MDA7967157.1 NAD-dependent protein deacylase [Ruegeria sp.]
MSNLKENAKQFVDMILSSSNLVAMTGAGISTESGIPDYRSPGSGLWEKMDQSVVSLSGFIEKPSRYYDYSLELYPIRRAAKPNPGHDLLAELENREILKGIITQNVDGLHQDAGSGEVHELHGSLRQAVCMDCSVLQSMDEAMERVLSGQNPPLCQECGGVLKPNAVFFGEALPVRPWERSVELSRNADLFIAIGSSLLVSPANTLPDIAIRNGSKIIVLNNTPTPFDGEAELLVRDQIGEFSSVVMEILSAKNS